MPLLASPLARRSPRQCWRTPVGARLSALLLRGNAAVHRAAQPALPAASRQWCEGVGTLPHLVPDGECAYELCGWLQGANQMTISTSSFHEFRTHTPYVPVRVHLLFVAKHALQKVHVRYAICVVLVMSSIVPF